MENAFNFKKFLAEGRLLKEEQLPTISKISPKSDIDKKREKEGLLPLELNLAMRYGKIDDKWEKFYESPIKSGYNNEWFIYKLKPEFNYSKPLNGEIITKKSLTSFKPIIRIIGPDDNNDPEEVKKRNDDELLYRQRNGWY